MFAEQRRRKQGLSVVLYLDIKNAFNAVNHRAVYHILEAKGFPAADITLFRRLYTGAFLVMSNQFGQSAACKLSRGMPQGAPPSPVVFSLVIDLIHSIVRNSKRGCTLQGSIAPTGSSGFADDSPLHTDGFDAVPAMAILVPKVAAYVEWAGMEYALSAFQYSSRSAVGPYLTYSRGWPSDPGALSFGCRRAHLSNVSKSIGRLIRGGVPAGTWRISSNTSLGTGQGGIGAMPGSS